MTDTAITDDREICDHCATATITAYWVDADQVREGSPSRICVECLHAGSATPPTDGPGYLDAVHDVAPRSADITDEQIDALQRESRTAGDSAQGLICAIALAAPEDGEDWVGPDGMPLTRTEARAECARVIADAAAQDDEVSR